jgi:hypothetical protein
MSSFPSKLNSPFAKAVLWLVTGVALTTAAVLATRSRPDEYRALDMVMRTYTVAPALEVPLRQALQYTLDKQGRIIETGLGGQLLIAAPQAIQDQIPDLLASLGNAGTRAPNLQFDVWYVLASDGPSNLDEPAFQSIRGTLEQIVKVDGPKRFEIRQRKALRVQSGRPAQAMPILRRINNPRLLRRPDGAEMIVAEVELGDAVLGSVLTTHVQLVPGETLVISQTTQKGTDRLETLYHIMRASL